VGDRLTATLVTAALTDGSLQHAALVYDNKAGTLTLYLNGVSAASAVCGTGLRPNSPGPTMCRSAGRGARSRGANGTGFNGILDALTIISTAGVDITDEDLTALPPRKSFLTTVLERHRQEWANPADPSVLMHLGMDEDATLTGVMYDSSTYQQNGTYPTAGGVTRPTNATRLAVRSMNGNWIGTTREATINGATDRAVNIAIAGGEHFYQILRT